MQKTMYKHFSANISSERYGLGIEITAYFHFSTSLILSKMQVLLLGKKPSSVNMAGRKCNIIWELKIQLVVLPTDYHNSSYSSSLIRNFVSLQHNIL